MRKLLVFIFLGVIFHTVHAANIDLAVSPIKYEINVTSGQATTKTITFYNNSNESYTIYLSAEDCTADVRAGTPKCRPNTSSGVDPQSLATWITFDGADRFTVPGKWEKKVNFTITPPAWVSPGWHYGAVFLNNLDTSSDGWNTVKMIRRAWVLLLVNVPGKLIYNTEIGDIAIDIPLESAPNKAQEKNMPTWKKWTQKILQELDPRLWSDESEIIFDDSDFVVTFTLPVKNSGNTHIMPLGRIELYDEDGILLERVGKEGIRTPEWVFLWEKIVDYLPINDETSSVLPGSDRIFTVLWKWFAYETIEAGKSVIKYLTPAQYYNQLENKNTTVLKPWERYRTRPIIKNITAKIYLEYRWEGDDVIPYEREEIIKISYTAPQKELNYGMIAIAILFIALYWIWRAYRREDTRINRLEAEIEYVEAEIDELEKGKALAKKALEKKAQKKSISTKMPVETPAPAKKPVAKKSPAPEALKKPRAPRTPKSQS